MTSYLFPLFLIGAGIPDPPPVLVVADPPRVVPSIASGPAASSCFVWRHSGGFGQSGTGTCIACEGGKSLVVTNAHVIEGSNAPVTVINGGKEYRASVLAVARPGPGNGLPDLALIAVDGVLPVAPVADREPEVGERVRLFGFGGRMGHDGPREKSGRFLGRVFNSGNVNAAVPTIPGDSGSGWFNDRGELVAVHWGNDGNAWAVPLATVRDFLRERRGWSAPKPREDDPPPVKAVVTWKEADWPDTTGRMCRWLWPDDPAMKPKFLRYVAPLAPPVCLPGGT